MSSVPRPGAWFAAFRTETVTNELISWITLPASFVTFTVRVKGSPARTVEGETAASRWKPVLIARTWVELPAIASRRLRSARPFTSGWSAGTVASGSLEVRCTRSVGPLTGFHHESVANTVTVKA